MVTKFTRAVKKCGNGNGVRELYFYLPEAKVEWIFGLSEVRTPSLWMFNYFFLLSGYTTIEKWVVSTHWDAEVTTLALSLMSTLNRHKELLIYVLITNSVIHALCGLNLIIGGCLGTVLNNLSILTIFGHELFSKNFVITFDMFLK